MLRWSLAWDGEKAKWLEEIAEEEGRPPKALIDRPELFPGNEWYLEAFWELSTDRDAGMALGPIPFSAINQYGKRLALDAEEFDTFRIMIRALDGAYLDHAEARRKAREKQHK